MLRTSVSSTCRGMFYLLVVAGLCTVCSGMRGHPGEDLCPPDSMKCYFSDECVNFLDICNKDPQCQSGEDEDPGWCELYYDSKCTPGRESSLYTSCTTWTHVCGGPDWRRDDKASKVCPYIRQRLLPKPEQQTTTTTPAPPPSFDLDAVLAMLAASKCSSPASGECPALYERIAGSCVAMLPFVATWTEAKQACAGINGILIGFYSSSFYAEVVQHLTKDDISMNFWTAGFYNDTSSDWEWYDTVAPRRSYAMTMGPPFWTLVYNKECVPRQSTSMGPFPGCSHYQQAPIVSQTGRCAAINFDNRYYISDEDCFSKRQPLCVLKK